MSTSPPREARLHLRATARQAALIRAAATAANKNMTDFILDAATTTAEQMLADRRWFVVDAVTYDRFIDLLDRPDQDNAGLAELIARPRPARIKS